MTELKRLLLSHQSELFRYAMRLTGNECAAWDLLQDTSVRVLMHKGCYSEQGSFLVWAKVVMKHIFYNKQKAMLRQTFIFDDSNQWLDDCSPAVADERADGFYNANELLSMIDRLPARHGRAFRLFIDGHSYANIAVEMCVSVDNVRNYIHAARVALRKMLSGD